MLVIKDEACGFNVRAKPLRVEDSNVAAIHCMVGIADLPADPLRKVSRNANRRYTASF